MLEKGNEGMQEGGKIQRMRQAQWPVVESIASPKEPRSRKRKREIEDHSPSAEAVSKKNLTE